MNKLHHFRIKIVYYFLKLSVIPFGLFICFLFMLPGALIVYPIHIVYGFRWDVVSFFSFILSFLFYYWLLKDVTFSKQVNKLINLLNEFWEGNSHYN